MTGRDAHCHVYDYKTRDSGADLLEPACKEPKGCGGRAEPLPLGCGFILPQADVALTLLTPSVDRRCCVAPDPECLQNACSARGVPSRASVGPPEHLGLQAGCRCSESQRFP